MKVKDPAMIRRKRKNRQYSQRDLAFLCKRSQAAIYQIEKGTLPTITEDFGLLLAARLGVDWEDLFELEEAEFKPKVTNQAHATNKSPRARGKAAA
ncbi:helix-turn-helix domain-containing protein [Brevibacterium sp. 91QC2O2]|uniref:helix-turn-helix transcriptional regulator n=1 Tax=Brevibacterium TaxID=1696 RepID=UPI00211BEE66|nr:MULTISPECIES: helix-turn-helix transcriptional regulator [unclassified Brevibacterium]MCQ9367381.1 helix-turn-helix domain-containing protein [Brevibacterium sp. 91QC2O2]MCQ9384606.1 helix-turn-helix domain-containing protein [Brevibacterium sp. 68QC2CO]